MSNGSVRFVRIRGRIVPIRDRSVSGDIKKREALTSQINRKRKQAKELITAGAFGGALSFLLPNPAQRQMMEKVAIRKISNSRIPSIQKVQHAKNAFKLAGKTKLGLSIAGAATIFAGLASLVQANKLRNKKISYYQGIIE